MIDPRDAGAVREALLAHLHAKSAWSAARCSQPLRPVLGGNQSFVYALELQGVPELSGPLILRILRPYLPQESVEREARVQQVLGAAGYPVARVLHACSDASILGGAFQLMECLGGRPIVGAAAETQGTIGLRAALADFRVFVFGPWPAQIAGLQHQLHSLSLEELRPALGQAGLPPDAISFSAALARIVTRSESVACAGLAEAFGWLREGAEAFESGRLALCHGDFFPNQVMSDAGRITGVIDWSDVCIAPPELDVAVLKVGIETLPVPIPFGGRVLRARARRFFDAYARLAPLDPAALEYAEALRCAHSLLAIAERRRALTADPDAPPNPNPYDSPSALAELSGRLERISGCRVSVSAT